MLRKTAFVFCALLALNSTPAISLSEDAEEELESAFVMTDDIEALLSDSVQQTLGIIPVANDNLIELEWATGVHTKKNYLISSWWLWSKYFLKLTQNQTSETYAVKFAEQQNFAQQSGLLSQLLANNTEIVFPVHKEPFSTQANYEAIVFPYIDGQTLHEIAFNQSPSRADLTREAYQAYGKALGIVGRTPVTFKNGEPQYLEMHDRHNKNAIYDIRYKKLYLIDTVLLNETVLTSASPVETLKAHLKEEKVDLNKLFLHLERKREFATIAWNAFVDGYLDELRKHQISFDEPEIREWLTQLLHAITGSSINPSFPESMSD